MRLTLSSSLADHRLLRDLLNVMSPKSPTATSSMTVVSKAPLETFFRENDLEAYVQ